jgi:hypothetical protein
MREQRESNPDVNTYIGGRESQVEDPNSPERHNDNTNIEGRRDDDVIPVLPDRYPVAPVEEPPTENDGPVGDVDDSPKKIA